MNIFRLGELVYVSLGYANGNTIGGYGPIVKMVDLITGELYQEKNVITGHGDKNTKILIYVNIMWIGNTPWDWEDLKDEPNPKVLSFDPHSVIKIEYEKMLNKYHKMIFRMDKKMEILKKYYLTRDDKINLIIED